MRTPNPQKLLAAIRKQEKRAIALLQDELNKKREAAVSVIIEPLQKRKGKFLKQIEAFKRKIERIENQVSSLLGKSPKRRAQKPSAPILKRQKKRISLVAGRKMAMGQKVYDTLAKNKNGLPRKALLAITKPLEPRVLVAFWNKQKPDSKISVKGDKSKAVYVVQ